jgi:hypothetical protein
MKEVKDIASINLYQSGNIGDIEIYLSSSTAPTVVRESDVNGEGWGELVTLWSKPSDAEIAAERKIYGVGAGAGNMYRVNIQLPPGSQGQYIVIALLGTNATGDARYCNIGEIEVFQCSENGSGPTVIDTWYIGDPNEADVKATLTDDGVLTFSGEGNMKTFGSNYDWLVSTAPWVLVDAVTGELYAHKDEITSVVIEEGITNIGSIGWGLPLSGTLTIPSTVTTISSRAFNGHQFEGSIVIPEGVTTIGSYAFEAGAGNTVTELYLPASYEIGGGAYHIFDNMDLLKVDVNGLTPTAFGDVPIFNQSTFDNAPLYVPAGTAAAYAAADVWKNFNPIIEKTTSINEVATDKPIKLIRYFDLLGNAVRGDAKGFVFKQIIYEDNTSTVKKTFVLDR